MTRPIATTTSEPVRKPRLSARSAPGRPAPALGPSVAGQLRNGFARLTARERHQMITALAHHLAQERGFAPGRELDDWLAAEKTIDALFI